jgi:hypothetical protein
MVAEKIQLLHPQGKNAPNINLDTYKIFERAILSVLKVYQPLTFTDLSNGVKDFFMRNNVKFNGSVDWYTISVKYHLESTNKITVFVEKGKKMHRLT